MISVASQIGGLIFNKILLLIYKNINKLIIKYIKIAIFRSANGKYWLCNYIESGYPH